MLIEHILYGIKLWALQLVPSLFPFMILTKCFLWMKDHSLFQRTKMPFPEILSKLWHLSYDSLMLLFLGLLCGYPVGAKTIAEQYSAHKISKKEAEYLMTICNQSSPAFILTYFISYALEQKQYTLQIIFLLYFSTFITSLFTRHIYTFTIQNNTKKSIHPSESTSFFIFLDDCICSCASVCIKICGYIILFCSFSALCITIMKPLAPLHIWITSFFELTYGLVLLKEFTFPSIFLKNLFLIGCFSFGGLCTMAQIKGMLVETSLSLKPYIIGKCIYTIIVLILYAFFQLCVKII